MKTLTVIWWIEAGIFRAPFHNVCLIFPVPLYNEDSWFEEHIYMQVFHQNNHFPTHFLSQLSQLVGSLFDHQCHNLNSSPPALCILKIWRGGQVQLGEMMICCQDSRGKILVFEEWWLNHYLLWGTRWTGQSRRVNQTLDLIMVLEREEENSLRVLTIWFGQDKKAYPSGPVCELEKLSKDTPVQFLQIPICKSKVERHLLYGKMWQADRTSVWEWFKLWRNNIDLVIWIILPWNTWTTDQY